MSASLLKHFQAFTRVAICIATVVACGATPVETPEYLDIEGAGAEEVFEQGVTKKIGLKTSGLVSVKVTAPQGWEAGVNAELSQLSVTAPIRADESAADKGSVTLLAATKSGKSIEKKIDVSCPDLRINEITVRIATYNLWVTSTITDESSEWHWKYRKNYLAESIAKSGYDIIGFQEMNSTIRSELPSLVYTMRKDLGWKWFGRDNQAGSTGEAVGIAYNMERFSISDFKAYWISETPDVVSYGWDETKYHRVVTTAIFTEKESGIKFRVTATHMPLADNARANGAKLIVERELAREESIPSFLLGDMNAHPDDPATATFGTCWKNCYDVIPIEEHVGPESTYNGHNLSKDLTKPESRIDYVYFRGAGVTPLNYKVDDTKYNGVWTSDHFPVSVDFKIERTSDNQK